MGFAPHCEYTFIVLLRDIVVACAGLHWQAEW